MCTIIRFKTMKNVVTGPQSGIGERSRTNLMAGSGLNSLSSTSSSSTSSGVSSIANGVASMPPIPYMDVSRKLQLSSNRKKTSSESFDTISTLGSSSKKRKSRSTSSLNDLTDEDRHFHSRVLLLSQKWPALSVTR